VTLADYPAATPENLAALARLLADRGVGLRVSPGGELQLRDRDKRLSPADRRLVRHYREPLAGWLAAEPPDETGDADPAAEPIDPDAPRCDRCGRGEFVEVAVHGGASVRRDCARCGRTWGFPVWRGEAD